MLLNELEYCITSIAEGKIDFLKNIYDILGKEVYLYAYTIIKDKDLAEDVAQDVFVKILRRAKTYLKGKNPKVWIMAITHNEAINVIRKRKNIIFSEYNTQHKDVDNNVNIEKTVVNDEIINTYINKLEDTQQMIVRLHLLSDLTFKEVSNILGISMGKVTWQYNSAIKTLKTNIENREVLL